ncbi:FtsW/RodA/SpoVE family cell cycle protein, partial [Streptomyces sp. UNOC14_S4]|uniref:FtsW/RodA/SpoVE family cell cycle protein n=1 Tax=Streptomyces sp. UNOC14_S4 TaxID=2872340 RepID=UPI001E57EEB2
MSATDGYKVRRFSPERGVWGRLTARDSVLRRLDGIMLLAVLALSMMSTALVYSATRNRAELNHGDPYYFLLRNFFNIGAGMAMAIGAVWVGLRALRGAVVILYGISLLLILAVLTPLGATINGARSWIQLGGGFSIQPTEFTKITIILMMATVLAGKVDAGDRAYPDHRTVVEALGLAALPVMIILLMPDLGSVMVIVVIVLAVLLASGASNRWIAGLLAAGVLGCVLVWQLGVLDTYQINRFAAFANPALDPSGVGYNTNQARIAIGSGGLTGAGLFHGSQTTGQFVPEQQTDFIFTVAGEELGFLGAGTIILLLGVVLWRACRIARESTELYSTVVAAGVVAWFAFQSFENIGMTLGIMPVAGIPLPFVSYGGSSM